MDWIGVVGEGNESSCCQSSFPEHIAGKVALGRVVCAMKIAVVFHLGSLADCLNPVESRRNRQRPKSILQALNKCFFFSL